MLTSKLLSGTLFCHVKVISESPRRYLSLQTQFYALGNEKKMVKVVLFGKRKTTKNSHPCSFNCSMSDLSLIKDKNSDVDMRRIYMGIRELWLCILDFFIYKCLNTFFKKRRKINHIKL